MCGCDYHASIAVQQRADRIFYTATAIAIAAIVFAGFGPTFYLRSSTLPPLSALLIIHGALFTLWIVLLIAQTALAIVRSVPLRFAIGGSAPWLAFADGLLRQ
jgi:hypothetical protein